jgi:hypothetical protein
MKKYDCRAMLLHGREGDKFQGGSGRHGGRQELRNSKLGSNIHQKHDDVYV